MVNLKPLTRLFEYSAYYFRFYYCEPDFLDQLCVVMGDIFKWDADMYGKYGDFLTDWWVG